MTPRWFVLFGLLAVLGGGPSRAATDLTWQNWSAQLFEQAKRENRFVILDLEAVWCHWCHVMEETTYVDRQVVELIKSRYIPVRVDQDANPDLASRYGDWGWPATIVFAPDGTEIVKLSGYLPPPRMVALLRAIIRDPSPGPSIVPEPTVEPSRSAYLTPAQRARLLANYEAVYDTEFGGWGQIHKFIHTDSLDYALAAAARGDKAAEAKARQTLDAALALVDREWGGVYQYSDQRDWQSPHYEKIMWYQAQYLRQYSLAYAMWHEPAYLQAARDIHRYLSTWLSGPEGAFFTSQDADLSSKVDGRQFYRLGDQARRSLGEPRIDKALYARENGWAVSGLVGLYGITGDKSVLDQAERAARWVLGNRLLAGGGFRHGNEDRGGPFLGDTLAMGQAALDLHSATGSRMWLDVAARAGDFISATFAHEDAGFVTSAAAAAKVGVFSERVRQVEENFQLARFANLLHRYTGAQRHRDLAEHTMRYLASDAITSMRRFLVGVVLADDELATEPVHITVVGSKADPRAAALHKAARSYAALYKRLEWWDKREGALPNPDVTYPELDRPAVFACANQICSLPVFEPAGLAAAVQRMVKRRTVRR